MKKIGYILLSLGVLSLGSCMVEHGGNTGIHEEGKTIMKRNKIIKLEASFKEAMKDYFLPPEATKVEPLIPFFPMPGGALTANTQMLRDNGLMDKYPEVISAMGEAVKKGGFGTSVTPVSQFYFQQAFNNVMFGPWKKIAEGYGKMVLGYFGKTPVSPDPEVVKIAEEQLKLAPTTKNAIDINEAKREKGEMGVEYCKKILQDNNLPITDENIFIVASCLQLVTGHSNAKMVTKEQPIKLAAFEGHYETGPADMYLFG